MLIDKNFSFKKPTWLECDFPALVIDDFLSAQECERLTSAGHDFIKEQPGGIDVIHGGRTFLPWSSREFSQLKSKSSEWRVLCDKLSVNGLQEWINASQGMDFTKRGWTVYEDLNKFRLVEMESLNISRRLLGNRYLDIYEKLLESKVKKLPTSLLAAACGLTALNSLYRVLISQFLRFGSTPLVPLFDYSFSNSGYARGIHRDSDCRCLVLLLYLNSLDDTYKGGDLEIYGYRRQRRGGNEKLLYPAWPSSEECNLQHTIQPKPGRLVLFYNQYNAYHAVSKMSGIGQGRHFVYGGFTIPSSSLVNRGRLKNSDQSRTEFHLYR